MKLDVEIRNSVSAYLQQLTAEGRDLMPLMRMLACTMETETERNFAAQGRLRWLGLSAATLKKRGNSAKILQDTGDLAGSVNTDYGRDFAAIGSHLPYAAIRQLGDQAGRGKKITIPASKGNAILPHAKRGCPNR